MKAVPSTGYQLVTLCLLLLELTASTPKEWNWKNEQAVTSVKDQQNCSAGWAFAAVAAYESFLLRVSQVSYDLSEEYVIQCSGEGDCSGGKNIRKTMKFISEHGVAQEKDVPYRSGSYTEGKAQVDNACSATTVKWN